jgi:hypothetical protein
MEQSRWLSGSLDCNVARSVPHQAPPRASPRPPEKRRAACPRLRALPQDADDGDGDGPLDIDALAARLSAEADKLRRSSPFSSADTFEDFEVDAGSGAEDPTFRPFSQGQESAAANLDPLDLIGPCGLFASDFELIQELGQISIREEESADPASPLAAQAAAVAAVVAYTATYFSGMPFQDPVMTLVKEYLPGSRAVAFNELLVLKHLSGLPRLDDAWRTAAAPLSPPPVSILLGYFMAGPSPRAMELDPRLASTEPEDTIWVVQKWESLAPLSAYYSAQQTSGIGLGRLFGGGGGMEGGLRSRARMLRAVARGALRALTFCHDRGVVHGSLGSGSLLLSTFDDVAAGRLLVKLDNVSALFVLLFFFFLFHNNVPLSYENLGGSVVLWGAETKQLLTIATSAVWIRQAGRGGGLRGCSHRR